MKIYQSVDLTPSSQNLTNPSSLTIGNFDGCHLGHSKLIRLARSISAKNGFASMALSFDPRPEEFFSQTPYKEHLFTKAQKLRAFSEAKLDMALIQDFDSTFSSQTRESFFDDYLMLKLKTQCISVGRNFRFGKGRNGDTNWLGKRCEQSLCSLQLCEAVDYKNQPISSTRIRKALKSRQINEANEMLGRPYLIEGLSIPGKQIGRKIGVPTINLGEIKQLAPATGVYAGYLAFAAESPNSTLPILEPNLKMRPAAINCGYGRTFNQQSQTVTIEAHILDGKIGDSPQYEKEVGIYFSHYIREEKTFSSPQELQHQIARDIKKIKYLLEM